MALAGGIVVMLWAAGGLQGPIRGDDAFYHEGIAVFIARYWPHIWWFPQSHAGEPAITANPLLPHVLLALGSKVGVTPGLGLKIILGFGFVGMAWMVYIFARSLRIGPWLSVALSSLVFTGTPLWGWSLIGGAYIRVAAAPFFFLSAAATFWSINAMNNRRPSQWPYRLLVASLVAVALIHPLVFEFTLPTVVLMIWLGGTGWSHRLKTTLRVLLPVAVTVAWQYIPIILSLYGPGEGVPGAIRNDVSILRKHWLFSIPQAGEFSQGLGPILFVAGLLGAGYAAFAIARLWHSTGTTRSLVALLMTGVVTSAYFALFAWATMPARLYLMAGYDYATWAVMNLTLVAVALAALLSRVHERDTWVGIVVLGGAGATIAASFSWLTHTSSTHDPSIATTDSYASRLAVDRAIATSPSGYRIGAVDRADTRWISYMYPDVEYLGGRTSASPNRPYYESMLLDTFYRLESASLNDVYFEDRPKIARTRHDPDANFYPAMFWLDWYASTTALLDLPFNPHAATALGYQARPQFFTYESVTTRFGAIGLAHDGGASPEVVDSVAPTVAVPFSGEEPRVYDQFLGMLSALDLDSRYLIPVRLNEDEGLGTFSHALVTYSSYVKHRADLDGYIARGGRLTIVGHDSSPARPAVVQLSGGPFLDIAVGESSYASGHAFASVQGGRPVGGCSPSGAGERCAISSSMDDLGGSASVASTLFLLDGLDLGYRSEVEAPQGSAPASDARPPAPAAGMSGGTGSFHAYSGGSDADLAFPFAAPITVNGTGLVNFAMSNPGTTLRDMTVTLRDDNAHRSLRYLMPAVQWSGTRTFSVPLSAFSTDSSWTGERATSLAFRFATASGGGGATPRPEDFSVTGATVVHIPEPPRAGSPAGHWDGPTGFGVAGGQPASGVLWKENFSPSWKATAEGKRLDVFEAGPGMMWVHGSPDAQSVEFDLPFPGEFRIGFLVTGAGLLALCLWWQRRRLMSWRGGRPRRHGSSGWTQ